MNCLTVPLEPMVTFFLSIFTVNLFLTGKIESAVTSLGKIRFSYLYCCFEVVTVLLLFEDLFKQSSMTFV